MSYDLIEKQEEQSPIELYKFTIGDKSWCYTSASDNVSYLEDDYLSLFLIRSSFANGGDSRKSSLSIEIAASSDIVALFRYGWLPETMLLTVFRHHELDNEYVVIWKGRITGCSWSGVTASLNSESVFTLFRRSGLRKSYSTGCEHTLYSVGCNVNKDLHMYNKSVTEVTGRVLTIPSLLTYADNYFTGGIANFGNEWRMIVSQANGSLTMISAIPLLADNDVITIWPGCDRTMNTCSGKFSNEENFGGFPFTPQKNPFSGSPLV